VFLPFLLIIRAAKEGGEGEIMDYPSKYPVPVKRDGEQI